MRRFSLLLTGLAFTAFSLTALDKYKEATKRLSSSLKAPPI